MKDKDEKYRNFFEAFNTRILQLEKKDTTKEVNKQTKQPTILPKPNPTIKMNLSGNTSNEQQDRTHLQPLDYTKVTMAWKHLKPKQDLSKSTHQAVEEKTN